MEGALEAPDQGIRLSLGVGIDINSADNEKFDIYNKNIYVMIFII